MRKITQDLLFRQSVVKYALKYGVSKTARRFKLNRQYVYFWLRRYNGDIESLIEQSRRPLKHKNQQTEEELELIKNLVRRNGDIGMMDLWYKLRVKGYQRSLGGLYKALQRLKIKLNSNSFSQAKYIPKPYEQMTFPGEKVQIDVKFVPKICLVDAPRDLRLYQYTAIDEYSRLRYLEGFRENSSYTAKLFLEHTIRYFSFYQIKIKKVQTDNGPEFTKRFLTKDFYYLSLFEKTALDNQIEYYHIKPHTPRHNGKVERSHREDQKLFYNFARFFSFSDFKTQLKRHQTRTNNRPMRPLNFLSPRQFLSRFQNNRL